jgi:hypothetical protein
VLVVEDFVFVDNVMMELLEERMRDLETRVPDSD